MTVRVNSRENVSGENVEESAHEVQSRRAFLSCAAAVGAGHATLRLMPSADAAMMPRVVKVEAVSMREPEADT